MLVLSAPGLRLYLTESLHMWHTYNTCGSNVTRTIFRSKGQKSISYQLFKVFVVSTPWFHPFLTEGWCVLHHFQDKRAKFKITRIIRSFLCVRPLASSLFDRVTLIMTYIQCMRGWCAARPFQDERSKVKVTLVVISFVDIQHMSGDVSCTIFWTKGRRSKSHGLKFWLCPLRGFVPVLFDGITYTIFRTIGQRSRSHRSFQVFPLSALWLRPYLANNFIWSIHTTHEGAMCRTIFSGWKFKSQGDTGSFEFLSCPFCGFLLVCHWSALWLHAYLTGLWRLTSAAAVRSLDLLVSELSICWLPW